MTAPALPKDFVADGARRPHAVVIGSGFGGLAAAVRLGARGYRVTVLERLPEPGGRASVFRQDGFTFDAGPTIVTAPFLFEELWRLAGRRLADDVELRALDPFYRIRFDDGTTFDASADPAAMRAEVGRISPPDVAGYEAFLAHAGRVYRTGFEELGHVPFDDWTRMIKALPDLLRLGAHRSVYGMAAKYVKDERLRTLLSFHPLFIGGNPFSATSLYVLISWLERAHGVHYAMGGTGALVTGVAGLIARQGNRIMCSREVAEILTEGRRAVGVRLSTGEAIPADIVVSNADSAWTLRRMLPERLRGGWTDRKLDRARYSMGLFVWYFGTGRRYPDVPHHTILMGPRYRGLLADIFDRKVLADDFSLYLHRPTATDPSLAPAGSDVFYVLSPVPNLEAGIDWTKAAETYRRRIADRLEATLLPGLSGAVVTSRIMTPVDFRDRYLAYRGAAFGLEPVMTQSAWFRPHNRFAAVDGLFLVGAGTHPGAGLPGVLTSAKLLDQVVPDAASLAH